MPRSERARKAAARFKRERVKRRAQNGRWPLRDKQYLFWIRTLPCAVLEKRHGREGAILLQTSPTEAAHVGERGLGQKCSDREAIPLCAEYHRTGPLAHHVLGKEFWFIHGIDRDALIAQLNARYEEQK